VAVGRQWASSISSRWRRPARAAGAQQIVHLPEARLGAAAHRGLGVERADHGLGDLPALERLALVVVLLHGQHVGAHHHHLAPFDADALLQVFGQGGLARPALAHDAHKAVVQGGIEQAGAHVAHRCGLEHIVGRLHVVDERVARQREMLSRLGREGGVLQ
jgi:hypothetical protein